MVLGPISELCCYYLFLLFAFIDFNNNLGVYVTVITLHRNGAFPLLQNKITKASIKFVTTSTEEYILFNAIRFMY